ncbi:MAG: DUF721 domain-containing protein [Pseudomonadota bacterium]
MFVPRSVGALVPKLTKQALHRQGFQLYNLLSDWSNIVGPTWGESTCPQKVVLKPYGILHVRVDSGTTALLLKHAEPQILDRINSYFGYQAIRSLKLLQSPRPNVCSKPRVQKTQTKKATKALPLPPELESVGSEKLKQALAGLYQAMQSR